MAICGIDSNHLMRYSVFFCRCGGMVDAADSKSVFSNRVLVRVQSPASFQQILSSFASVTELVDAADSKSVFSKHTRYQK